jgi:Bifunctional DNA primase/polymerase, N-terminal
MTSSPYAQVGPKLVNMDYSAVPCRPGFKIPGAYRSGEWFYESEWQRFCDRLPTELELGVWAKWPDAGVCVALGFNAAVAVDIDTDDEAIVAAIKSALSCESPVQKRGKKGATHFFRASAAVKSRPFNVGTGERVLDLLCKGKQTVIPPTIHPDTYRPYEWLTDDTLEYVSPENLPMLPDDIAERIAAALRPFGYEAPVERSAPLGGSGTGREINDVVLANLDAWVPHLGIGARREGASWRAQAKMAQWRRVQR